MPSTYTLNNGIELISTGEQSGTWGDTTNTNLSLLDTALDGQVTVTLPSAGTSGSPNTLAITDGAASDGRNRMVTFADGGDLGATAFVQLTPNDSEKIIYVRNTLAGSRSIILFQGTYNASNDYEVPAGTTAVVYFDGAGSGAVAANVFNNAYFDSLRLGGVSVTAIIDDDSMGTATATNIATSESIKAYVDAQVGANNELSEVLANGNTTGGNNILFGDNDKAIFGAGSDLQIYHDGSHSIIKDAGTGNLQINAGNFNVNNVANTANIIVGNDGGEVNLYYNGSKKLATTSTGIDVTGTLDVNGGANSTQAIFSGTAGRGLVISTESVGAADEGVILNATASGTTGKITFQTNDATSLELAGNGGTGTFHQGLIVNEDSAASGDFRVESDANTHALFVDAGNGRVGLNQGTTTATLHVNPAGSDAYASGLFTTTNALSYSYIDFQNTGTSGTTWQIGVGGNGTNSPYQNSLYFYNSTTAGFFRAQTTEVAFNEGSADMDFRVESDSNTHMLFVDAGNNFVGIDTSNPVSPLVVSNGGASGIEFHPELSTNFNRITNFNRSTSAYNELGIDALAIELRPSGARKCSINPSDMVVNQDSADYDFRVESNSNANMLLVDGGGEYVSVNTNGSVGFGGKFNVNGNKGTGSGIPSQQITVADSTALRTGGGGAIQFNGVYDTSNNLTAAGSVEAYKRNATSGNYGFGLQFKSRTHGGTNDERLYMDEANTVFNDISANTDFRVESDANTHALFVDAGNNQVVVGTSSPITGVGAAMTIGGSADTRLAVDGSSSSGIYLTDSGAQGITIRNASGDLEFYGVASGEFVFNEGGLDTDFRVESDSISTMFVVDAAENVVGIRDADVTLLGSLVSRGEATYSSGNVAGLFYANSGNRGTIRIRSNGDNSAECAFDVNGALRWMISARNSSDTYSMKWYPASGTPGYGIVSGQVMTLTQSGDLTINGALSKGSGSFKIKHPLPEKNATHDLVHSFVEAPQADNIYRGKVALVAGQASVNIDTVAGMTEGTFAALNREVQCFTSNETGWTAVRGSVSGNILAIEAQDNTCTDTISWMVIGERQDEHMYDTGWTDENGKVIVEPLRPAGSDDPS